MLRTGRLLALIIVLLLISSCLVGAGHSTYSVPYHSYTYDFWSEPVAAPQAYQPLKVIGGKELEIDNFRKPQDIFAWNNSLVYVADTGNNRIVVIDKDWNLVKVISSFNNNGQEDTFNQPYGIHVSEEGVLYIADRNNNRIVVLDSSGELLRIISSPVPGNEDLFNQNFNYFPIKISVDNVGRTYVIADKVYEGIMEFDLDGKFRGFIGAPRVNPNIIDYLWRRFSSRARQERLSLILPTEYSNLHVDEKGFIYTTVASGQIRQEEAVRRLNPAGADVLKREGFTPPIGDHGSSLRNAQGEYILPGSSFVDIWSRENGIYSVLDKERGRVFTYDYYGDLLYVFGEKGNNRGNFLSPVALTVLDDYILVLDEQLNSITVFTPTYYQKLIHTALDLYNRGLYRESAQVWSQLKDINANYDLAYTGIGKAHLQADNFLEAMVNFKLGQDRSNYSKAFELYRKEVIEANINTYIFVAVLLILLLSIRKKIYRKIGEGLRPLVLKGIASSELAAMNYIKAEQWTLASFIKGKLGILYLYLVKTIDGLSFARYVIFHPFDGFWDLKHEKRGNLPAATVLLIFLSLTYVFQRQYMGFIFNTNDLANLNILFEFSSVLIPFMLWVIVNWSLTTLMEGKGTFSDIYIATAYAFTPVIIINIPVTIISNFLLEEEGVLIGSFIVISLLWSLFLLFFGTMTIHQYDSSKNILVTILVIFGIAFTMFIGVLFFNLGEHVMRFVSEIYNEIFLRL
ncbi:MAG TPA: DUF1282 family protein [Halanaerobiaceae bacterium]|nr:YIP1 family protein [Bacillota bacterium]HHU93089.1 DUF1282 family protein [Halanaerobiaceae bacterium]HOA41608.1 YIP1 family protein [Halanaerobiales bacterium]HPZ63210.1 YIP1 family protein [Halanaerobiales bacterium]HQD04436.1 YIP1 family protein [Halanaerobiales bacterium]